MDAESTALDATIRPSQPTLDTGPAVPDSLGPLPRIPLSGTGPGHAQGPSPGPEAADFEVLRVLGEGGMGRVYVARQRSLGREVAIKTLKAEADDPRAAAMLRVEATTMGRLEHPNVVPVHSVGLDAQGRLVLVMKRIDGVSWRALLKDPKHPRWSLLEGQGSRLDAHLDVLAQVARALHFAHDAGVVHRDVKPENVLIGAQGEVYLADWGVALRLDQAASAPRQVVGTPAYLAPEMVGGDPLAVDRRTDVFLLGASLHEVLTGRPPHHGASIAEALANAAAPQPPVYGPDVLPLVGAIAARAMAGDPAQRFQSALEFRQALELLRRHRGSMDLARSGRALLERARTAADDPTLDRHLIESRFALTQALRDWPENTDARAALDDCLRLSVAHELDRENPRAAEALLGELSAPDAALRARVAEVAARLALNRDAVVRLREVEAEHDPRVGSRARTWGIAALFGLALTLTTLAQAWQSAGREVTSGDLAGFGGAVFFSTLAVLALFRKSLLVNTLNRRAALLLVLSTGALAGQRLVAHLMGIPPMVTVIQDLVLLGAFAGGMGLLIPGGAWLSLVCAAGVLVALVFPHWAAAVFSATTFLNLGAILAFWIRAERQRAAQGEHP